MNAQTSWLVGFAVAAAVVAGCSHSPLTAPASTGGTQMRNVLLHIDGFQKSKSGIV